ncbi:unnamed protein product [Rhodiola kirilowii]
MKSDTQVFLGFQISIQFVVNNTSIRSSSLDKFKLNGLGRRAGEEERLLTSKAAAARTALIPKLLATLFVKFTGHSLE